MSCGTGDASGTGGHQRQKAPYNGEVSSDLTESPAELRESVERARDSLRNAGMPKRPPASGHCESSLTPDERRAVDAVIREGAYAAAVAEFGSIGPDLADQ